MVSLSNGGQCRRAAVIKASFGRSVEIGDMVRELVHQGHAQPAGFGEVVEQQRLIKAPHHYDPIDGRTIVREADAAI
jgi:hypothetical protein